MTTESVVSDNGIIILATPHTITHHLAAGESIDPGILEVVFRALCLTTNNGGLGGVIRGLIGINNVNNRH